MLRIVMQINLIESSLKQINLLLIFERFFSSKNYNQHNFQLDHLFVFTGLPLKLAHYNDDSIKCLIHVA